MTEQPFMAALAAPAQSLQRTPHAPVYTYLLCDLLTDQVLAWLPLHGVKFGRRISRAEAFKGKLTCPNADAVRLGRIVHDNAGKAALYVFRNGVLWWGGVLWTATPGQNSKGSVELDVQAATFDSYAHRRIIRQDITYTQVDQGVIVPDLWRQLQADMRGDIGVDAEDQPTGVLRDRTYLAGDVETYGDQIEEMGDLDDGPEHTIDVFTDSTGARRKRLRLDTRLGTSAPAVVFGRTAGAGGRMLVWSEPADATSGATTFQARGASEQENAAGEQVPLMSNVYEADELLSRGWPLIDHTVDRTDVKRQSTLNGHARAARRQLAGQVRTHKYEVYVGNTDWNPNRLGDSVRLKLHDLWHDPPVDRTVRPVGCEVTVAERGQGERVQLLFGEDG